MKVKVAGRDLGNRTSPVDRAHMKRPGYLVDPTLAAFIVCGPLQFLVLYLKDFYPLETSAGPVKIIY